MDDNKDEDHEEESILEEVEAEEVSAGASKTASKEDSSANQRKPLARCYTALTEGMRTMNYGYYQVAQRSIHTGQVFDSHLTPGAAVSLMAQTSLDIVKSLNLSKHSLYAFQISWISSFANLIYNLKCIKIRLKFYPIFFC